MNRSEFTSLPPSLALGLLWDAAHAHDADCTGHYLDEAEAPKAARPPKYDSAIFRKDGVMYASETDLDGLRFWHKRAAESAASGGQYAEKDEKQAKALAYWIAFREQQPTAIWTGERNREQVTARAPAAKPEVYPRTGAPRTAAPPASAGGGYSDADYGSDDPDDGIPFALNVSGEARERWWRS